MSLNRLQAETQRRGPQQALHEVVPCEWIWVPAALPGKPPKTVPVAVHGYTRMSHRCKWPGRRSERDPSAVGDRCTIGREES
eukprot:scaffold75047_cov66-Phaeocystis_antarctica.AAC.2